MKKLINVLLIGFILAGCSRPAEPVNSQMQGDQSPPVAVQAESIVGITESDINKAKAEMKKELGNDYLIDYLELPTPRSPAGRDVGGFIIGGNISRREFDRFKNGTIKECAEAMHRDFFEEKPDYLLKVYLFKDAETYEAYVQKTEGRKPSTPYGFYSDHRRSLVMNIGTGGGTLVHEMFHALVKPDFPDLPSWLNEGMGSLFEQCRVETDGTLRGLINWRYPILMEAAVSQKIIPLKELLHTTDAEFYGEERGVDYAQARYFCLYLQEKKVLPQFYKKFRDNFEKDKSGVQFVGEVLKKQIGEIDRDWQNWIPKVKEIKELQ